MKLYVIKVLNEYIYAIHLTNFIGIQTVGTFGTTTAKEYAMTFRHKYIANTFARMFNGKVEEK